MFKLSLNILLLCIVLPCFAQKNPHGFLPGKDCTFCHNTEDWRFKSTSFNHDSTGFVLTGQHRYVKCADCHVSLVFSQAQSKCVSCHTDMHSGTLGLDCENCHQTRSWIVENTLGLHEQSRFPLLGFHKVADCTSCHTSASNLIFEPLGVECVSCHQQDFQTTTNPNHVQAGLSTNCIDCHKIEAFEWSASGINHDFFPLIKGHAITNCASCHSNNLTEPLPTDCYSCHQNDYATTTNPSHQSLGFATDCAQCHTIDPEWKPAEYRAHDALSFPIYSGKHKGEWNNCADCHTQPNNYSSFSCVDCHEHNRSDMDDEHRGVNGYGYSSPSCFACHPTGDSESAFDHDSQYFPIYSGAHREKWDSCTACHTESSSFSVFSCVNCHEHNQNEMNDKHKEERDYIYESTSCFACHPTGRSN